MLVGRCLIPETYFNFNVTSSNLDHLSLQSAQMHLNYKGVNTSDIKEFSAPKFYQMLHNKILSLTVVQGQYFI
jgi:hypothetical protein